MGLLSFIYSVLGYNLCATLFIAYLMFDYVLGALATFGARYVMESKSGGAYDFYIRWIRVDYGWTELTLTIGPITFKNPKKFKMTPFLIKIDRISCRVNPRSFLDWIQKKKPMEVENVEIERMRLHMERDGKGEMNCWAALGTACIRGSRRLCEDAGETAARRRSSRWQRKRNLLDSRPSVWLRMSGTRTTTTRTSCPITTSTICGERQFSGRAPRAICCSKFIGAR